MTESAIPPKTVALVGGSGFIGSWLARALADTARVRILDIEPPPDDVAARCSYLRCDVRDPKALRGKLDGCQTVYLLAGLLAKRCEEEPDVGWQTNVAGTSNVLQELAGSASLRRVVFFSSSMVYASDIATFPLAETAPLHGERLYDRSKLIGEALLQSFCASYGVEGLVFRFFSIYGPGRFLSHKGHFIATWLELARQKLPLTVHGDGRQSIDLLHVQDSVRACLLGEELPIEAGEVETFNVGSGEDTPVRQIAEWIQGVDPDVELVFTPSPPATIRRRWADISRAEQHLGYRPAIRPEVGVIELARERLSRSSS